MKTITELEDELVEARKQDAEAWAKVQAAKDEYDKQTQPWLKIREHVEELQFQIKVLKKMEAAQ